MSVIYNFNEEVPCMVKYYDASTSTYTVETINDHVEGRIYKPSHPRIAFILKQARFEHKIVPLRFMKIKDGKPLFKYIFEKPSQMPESSAPFIQEENSTEENATEEAIVQTSYEDTVDNVSVENKTLQPINLTINLSGEDKDLSCRIIGSIVDAIGDAIDSEEKYNIASSIILSSNEVDQFEEARQTLYAKATYDYKKRFWNDDILPYTDNNIVAEEWNAADETKRTEILQRLGIDISSLTTTHNTTAPSDNSNSSITEMETVAIDSAIRERKTTQQRLNVERTNLSNRQQSLNQQHSTLRREQEDHTRECVQRIANARTEEERTRIQNEAAERQQTIQSQIETVEAQQQQVNTEISTIDTSIATAQQEINTIRESSSTQTIGGRGGLKINLKWNTIDDVDLHVYDPDNNHIYYGDKKKICQGILGQLDIDANAGGTYTTSPQENIYWEGKAPIGRYRISVNLYNKKSGASQIPVTVTFYPEKGEPKICTAILRTQKETIQIMEFDYTENGIVYNR